MKASILAGALAAVIGGGLASAQTSSPTVPASDPTTSLPPTATPSGTASVSDAVSSPGQRPPYTTPEPVYIPEDKNKMSGLTVLAGGGVEGYTGDLAPQINPGPSWRVTAAVKPTKVLGIEIGYSGAVNNLKGNQVAGINGRGADIIRNGVDAVATLGLSDTPVQPYILGGFGVSRYSVRDEINSLGFQSDTSERIPVGGGLRTHLGQFTADARFDYHVLVNEKFATTVAANSVAGVNSVSAGSYQGSLQFGATF